MKKRSSAPARIAAVLALVLAFVLAIAVVGGAFDSGDSDSNGDGGSGKSGQTEERPKRKVPAVYVIESGDTLIGIAHRTGVPVARIEALNPGIDPQILGAGEELKLR
jgi:LysM repeat protein